MKKAIISSKLQILLIMMIFIIPLMSFLIGYNIYTMHVLNARIAQSGQDTIAVYQKPLEKGAKGVENLMVNIVANDADFKELSFATDTGAMYFSSLTLIQKMKTLITTNAFIDAFFIYNEPDSIFREDYKHTYNYPYKADIKEKLVKIISTQKNLSQKGWFILPTKDGNALVRIFNKNDTYLIAMLDLNKMEKPNFDANNQESILFFTDDSEKILSDLEAVKKNQITLGNIENGKPYSIVGNQKKHLIVESFSEYCGLNFVYAVPYHGMFMGFDTMQFFLLGASLAIVVLMFISYRLLQQWYFSPLTKLIKTMDIIKSGDLDTRMESSSNILEFRVLVDTFNEMIEQIKFLKISSYEYQLETQQAKMQYLQIQIRPHFFLNCLKNIYGLAEEEKCKQIQDMLLALSSHLRYTFRDNLKLVPLSKELQNVKNYILLQQMTASYQISCTVDLDERLKNFEIPPLSIQTFIENSVKHAGTISKHLMINVKVNLLEGEDENLVNITILDNGAGFTEEDLQKLNVKTEFTYQEEHVGIQNVKHRCSLIYNNRCTFLFSSITGGACVGIFIPLDKFSENDLENGGL